MECFCGCGTPIGRRLTDAHLQVTAVALELLAWDKARTEGRIPGEEAEAIDSLIHRGALQYQHLLDAIHGERGSAPIAEGQSWLDESQALRLDRQYMTEKSWLRKGARLRLTEEEIAMLDRKQPDRSFSGRAASAGPGDDVAGQLERLGALHAEGVLSDEEFEAAKRRVLG
ncbi:MAG: hypothetical protein QOE75_1663 [Solirubrobacterales bacterium]|jgi:hypothetical protein|nr:hypothetical protein [Solirubrobacterales bacterium]